MKLQVNKHEDNRRTLTEWISDLSVKRCKIIEVKEDGMELGNHYHLKNDSVFYLFKGGGHWVLNNIEGNNETFDTFKEGDCLFVPRGVVHTFGLSKGSIMMEASTEPYDKEDEIQINW
jgi:mannose-6-phosphate isomerase-like protein (cupin superfamily)